MLCATAQLLQLYFRSSNSSMLVNRLLIFSWALTLLTRCNLISCENEIIEEIKNSNKGYKAVVFKRDCGATTQSSTQISIIPISQILPNEGGNVFVTESGNLSAEWTNDTTLLIKYTDHERIFKQDSAYLKIRIMYQKVQKSNVGA
jgi:hypothetical protein